MLGRRIFRHGMLGVWVVAFEPTVLPYVDLSASAIARRREPPVGIVSAPLSVADLARLAGVDVSAAYVHSFGLKIGQAENDAPAGGDLRVRMGEPPAQSSPELGEPAYDSPGSQERLRMIWGKRVAMAFEEQWERGEMIDETLAEIDSLPETRS